MDLFYIVCSIHNSDYRLRFYSNYILEECDGNGNTWVKSRESGIIKPIL